MTKTKKKPQKKKKITPRQRKFVTFYVESGNATEAYQKAGYNGDNAAVSASRLLTNVNILDEIEKKRKEIADKLDFTIMDVVNELAKIAFANSEDYFDWIEQIVETKEGLPKKISVVCIRPPGEIDRKKKAAIAGIKETSQGGLEFKFHDKNKALDSLKKYLGADNEAEVRKALELAFKTKQSISKITLPDDLSTPEKIKEASETILKEVSKGKMTPNEGAAMINLLDSHRKTLETVDLEKRIEELEDRAE